MICILLCENSSRWTDPKYSLEVNKIKKKPMSFVIDDGKAFFAHETSINFNPHQFTLDFKQMTPRLDPRSQEAVTMHMEHNVIMLDPFHAKNLAKFLMQTIEKYETEFGEIRKTRLQTS